MYQKVTPAQRRQCVLSKAAPYVRDDGFELRAQSLYPTDDDEDDDDDDDGSGQDDYQHVS